jgi:hypothetical protein
MKKMGYRVCIISFVFIMLSCATGSVWDASVPPEQSAKIAFSFFEPTSYNQVPVNKNDFAIVTIPAGPAEFSGDIAWMSYGAHTRLNFNVKDAVFSCELERGKEYWAVVVSKFDEHNKFYVWGINLYNDEIKLRVGFPDNDKLVGFIPFNPPIISN